MSPGLWVNSQLAAPNCQCPSGLGPTAAGRDELPARRVERLLLDGRPGHPDSVDVRKVWTPPVRWVLGVATALSFFSWWQAYRLTLLYPKPEAMHGVDVAKLLVLNVAYWYVPALLIPAIAAVARRFPLDSGSRVRAVVAHVFGALTFAIVRCAAMIGVRYALWGGAIKVASVSWSLYAQRLFFSDLEWCFAVYGVIVGTSHAVGYYHQAQEQKLREAQLETRLMEARLKTLEAELHPHFLFNTLHAISALLHRDPEDADRMISRLSDLLRITLDRSGAATITLKDEIEFLQKYLDIERTRFQDRLTVRVQIDPDALDAEVPRMILQPLAENALKHGIGSRVGAGTVQIAAGRNGDRLWMQVGDDGSGLNGSAARALNNGIGLSNTRARLDCLYGERAQLVFSGQPQGLTVRIEIPFTLSPEATDSFEVAQSSA